MPSVRPDRDEERRLGNEAKDITASSFGLLIAYVLPGFVALVTLAFWSSQVAAQFDAFLKSDSKIGLFLLVVLAALILGVELTAFRWVIFDRWLCRKIRLGADEFKVLQTQDKIAAFRMAIDEHYRYHQFWGGLVPVVPFFFLGVAYAQNALPCSSAGALLIFGFLVVESVTVAAAVDSYKRYVTRARAILT
jgi:uncharacterized membrane protein YwzB